MNYFIRAILAALGFVLATALVGPLFSVFGFHPGADLLQVIKICFAGIALFYVAVGPTITWRP